MNKWKLLEAMENKGVTRRYLANKTGISHNAMCGKIAGKSEFKLSEAVEIRNELDLSDAQAVEIFLR